MTQRYIAFLRAINVGGHNVKMPVLRTLFEELGFSAVETFIASGNVVFSTAAADPAELEHGIERHLRQALGYEVATFLRTPQQLAALLNYRPFPSDDSDPTIGGLHVAFIRQPLDPAAHQRLLTLQTPSDLFHSNEREIYWRCLTKLSESPVFAKASLEKVIKVPATMRNSTTLRKMAEKYSG